MEIVLQWLDDLDDALFAGVLVWERLRRICLFVSAGATAALAGSAAVAAELVPLLAAVAGAGVLLAAAGAAVAALADAFTTRDRARS